MEMTEYLLQVLARLSAMATRLEGASWSETIGWQGEQAAGDDIGLQSRDRQGQAGGGVTPPATKEVGQAPTSTRAIYENLLSATQSVAPVTNQWARVTQSPLTTNTNQVSNQYDQMLSTVLQKMELDLAQWNASTDQQIRNEVTNQATNQATNQFGGDSIHINRPQTSQGGGITTNGGSASHATTINLNPTIQIHATIREDADLDTLVAQIVKVLEEEIAMSAERAYT